MFTTFMTRKMNNDGTQNTLEEIIANIVHVGGRCKLKMRAGFFVTLIHVN